MVSRSTIDPLGTLLAPRQPLSEQGAFIHES